MKLKNTDLISIITPFHNSEKFLEEAIISVLNQSYEDWELLLVNDGSTDRSKEIALSFDDKRIKYLEQPNGGVSSARNVGLANMIGDYFCFFDSDDVLPKNSLKSRRLMFDFDSSIKFVDGVVNRRNHNLKRIKNIWIPDYYGNPLQDLVRLGGKTFFGPSWMIRRDFNKTYKLEEQLYHAEDLFFYMTLARDSGLYAFTNDTILEYRDTPNSAMDNLEGLESGYRFIENEIKNWDEVEEYDHRMFRFKYKKAMCLAYIKSGNTLKAFKIWF